MRTVALILFVVAGSPPLAAAQEWVPEPGARLSNAVSVEMVVLADGRLRAYYPGGGGIASAISSDGLTFVAESGVRLTGPATNPAVFRLSDGRLRMLYGVQTRTVGPPSEELFTAVSTDGVAFVREATGRFADPSFASVPSVIRLADRSLRLYYTHFDTATPSINVIRSARSTDEGQTWVREPGDRLAPTPAPGFEPQGMGDPQAIVLPDGRYRMFYTRFVQLPAGHNRIESAISDDGLAFTIEGTVFSVPGTPEQGLLVDPFVVPLANGRHRLYYSAGSSPGAQTFTLYSALSPLPALAVAPGEATGGQTVTLTVTAAPGQVVAIAASRASRGAGSLAGAEILLGADLTIIAAGVVGADSTYRIPVPVPPGLTGTYYLQAGAADDPGFTRNVRLTNGARLDLR